MITILDLSDTRVMLSDGNPPSLVVSSPQLSRYVNMNGRMGEHDINSWRTAIRNYATSRNCQEYLSRDANNNLRDVNIEAERALKCIEPQFSLYTDENENRRLLLFNIDVNTRSLEQANELAWLTTLSAAKTTQHMKLLLAIKQQEKKRAHAFSIVENSLNNDSLFLSQFRNEIQLQDPVLLFERIINQYDVMYNTTHLSELRIQMINMTFGEGESLDDFVARLTSYATKIRSANNNNYASVMGILSVGHHESKMLSHYHHVNRNTWPHQLPHRSFYGSNS